MVLHSAIVTDHEETDNSPRSVIYRPIGSTKQCSKINQPTSRRPTKFLSLLAFLVYIRQDPLPEEEKFLPKVTLLSAVGGKQSYKKKQRILNRCYRDSHKLYEKI